MTAVCLHPLDDKFFLSGGFDKKIRIWNIPESRVATWAQAPAPITSKSLPWWNNIFLFNTSWQVLLFLQMVNLLWQDYLMENAISIIRKG